MGSITRDAAIQRWDGKAPSLSNGRWLKRALGAARNRDRSIADGSDRKIDLGLGQALGILDRQVLRSAVRMVDQISVIWRFSLLDCLLQRVEHKLGLHGCRSPPAHDSRCEHVDDRAMGTALVRETMARGNVNCS